MQRLLTKREDENTYINHIKCSSVGFEGANELDISEFRIKLCGSLKNTVLFVDILFDILILHVFWGYKILHSRDLK